MFLDWKKDPVLAPKGGLDIVEALSPDGIRGLVERGKEYAKVLESDGFFEGIAKFEA